ncbi:neocarzinostatin apoprotein domain-containing protein [Actinoplanes sp. NPDC023936]|uniref:neocarzinostatin apoprotein domain-containing protein n=1 Tax=Actinoplanes sp. NPDC023936 TaxID=3154910 RepID=UPI0033CFF92F
MLVKRLAAATAAGLLCAAATLFLVSGPAAAKATLKVSKTTGLKDGDSITVSGTGFTKNLTDLALGQCVKNPKGPSDCNLAGGAVFAKTDGSGKTGTVTLKVAKSFSGKDCGTGGCVIAAQLLPSSHDAATVTANAVSVKITFGGGGGGTTATTKPATTTQTATTRPASSTSTAAAAATTADDEALPKTGPGLEWATVVLIGTGLLLPGFGLLAMLPARRRRMAGFR